MLAQRPITVRDLLTFTWGVGMQGAMFVPNEPWPIVRAGADLHTFGPPEPAGLPDPDRWMARLGELPLLGTAYALRDGELAVLDPPDGQWSRPPRFPDGGGRLLSTVDDMVAFGRMLLGGGRPILTERTVAEMTRDQLTAEQRARVWPGYSVLDEDGGWGYGVSVLDDGRPTWDGGLGTARSDVPSDDLVVVLLT